MKHNNKEVSIKFLLMAFFFFSFQLNAEIYISVMNQQRLEKKIEIIEVQHLHINDVCNKNINLCLNYIKKKISQNDLKPKENIAANPASLFCQEIKGRAMILNDNQQNQYSFCEFPNGIIIDSWDLYMRLKK